MGRMEEQELEVAASIRVLLSQNFLGTLTSCHGECNREIADHVLGPPI